MFTSFLEPPSPPTSIIVSFLHKGCSGVWTHKDFWESRCPSQQEPAACMEVNLLGESYQYYLKSTGAWNDIDRGSMAGSWSRNWSQLIYNGNIDDGLGPMTTGPSSRAAFYLQSSRFTSGTSCWPQCNALADQMAVAQIYIFTLYPGPKFTQPTFTQKPNLHNTKFTRDPYLHEPTFTLPQIYITQFYTNPIYTATKLHQTQIFTVPNLHRSQFYTTKGHTFSRLYF